MYKPYDKKEIDRHDSNLYCPTSIKETIKWFKFLTIIEHTGNIINPNKGLITSLLKVFAMLQLRSFDDKEYKEGKRLNMIAIRGVNCNKEICLYLRNSMIEEMITNFVLNAILHHVGMLLIIFSNE